jgi:hypothetical protein
MNNQIRKRKTRSSRKSNRKMNRKRTHTKKNRRKSNRKMKRKKRGGVLSTEKQAGGTTKEDTAQQELPSNWEMRTTENGRPFFIDHTTRTTTWVDPRPTAQQELPSNWEMRTADNGRPFIIDHATRTWWWVDPRPTAQQDPADEYTELSEADIEANIDRLRDPQPTDRPTVETPEGAELAFLRRRRGHLEVVLII